MAKKKKNKNSGKPQRETLHAVHNPHDKALFMSLRNHRVARDAMRAHLPQELLAIADLSGIRQYRTKLVTPEFRQFEADVFYEIPLKDDRRALILMHCEQQTTVDVYISLRVWQYLLLVLMEYAKNHRGKPLPVVYPLVLYTGEAPWRASTDILDLFGEHRELAAKYLFQPLKLVDVCRMSDEDIRRHELFGLSELAFKHRNTQEFAHFLGEILPWVHDIELQLGKDYARMILKYMVHAYPRATYDALLTETENYLSDELRTETMTIAQQLREQGMQQGILQGMQQGANEKAEFSAVNMLKRGLSVEMIAECIGMRESAVRALAKKSFH